jgi:membrane protease YdiL (CAAX protease family)
MITEKNELPKGKLGEQLQSNRLVKIAEILIVFFAAFAFIKLSSSWVNNDPILKQASVWVANVLMLILVWLGLRLRGQGWRHFGLSFKFVSWKRSFSVFGLSLLVFVLALAGFVLGAIIMANIIGIPEGSDMSGYDYLKDNLPMFLLTLAGVLTVSSFGEEVIYRGFLMNRIMQFGGSEKQSRIIAVIISALVFGLVHYEWGAMGVVQTTFMGLAMAICYLKFNQRLIILILAHAYMDIILMTQMYLSSQ